MSENYFEQLRIVFITRAGVYGLKSKEFQHDIILFLEELSRNNDLYRQSAINDSRIAEAKINAIIFVDALIGELRNYDRYFRDEYRHSFRDEWANRAFHQFRASKNLFTYLENFAHFGPFVKNYG